MALEPELDRLMATMVSRQAPLPLPALQALAREHYGLAGTLSPLTGERDQNVRLRAADGSDWVLKVAHPEEPEAEADLPRAALLHVQGTDPALPCPRVLATLRGDTVVRFIDAYGARRSAYLVSFLPGRTLAEAPRTQAQRVACGHIAGRLARAMAGFEHPGAYRRLIWDVRELRCVPALLADIADFPDAARTRSLLQALIERLQCSLQPLRTQIVHNDLNALNVLVDRVDPARIAGVIDFGDAVHTALISDAAVAAAELIPDECSGVSEAMACVLDVLRAYDSEMPLTASERAELIPLISARLLTNLVVQQWHRRRNPDGGHYIELAPDFIRMRIGLARMLFDQGSFAGT